MNGGCGSTVRVPWTSAVQIPTAMGFELAAALPAAYVTAWIALMDIAHIEKGSTVLIHDAGSAIGQAAISLAKYVGAEIFATVSSAEHGSFMRHPRSQEWHNLTETTDMSWQQEVIDVFHHYTERTQGELSTFFAKKFSTNR